MILTRLEENQAGKLRKIFHNHPLLRTCQDAFHHYMAEMAQFNFTSEELFVEAANAIDNIFDEPSNSIFYINELWDNTKIKLKKSSKAIPPQEDLNIVCAVLFYVLAATFRLHWQKYYNTDIVNKLVEIVRIKEKFNDDNVQREIIENLCLHADALENWIIEYEDSNEWLSDEIEQSLRGQSKIIKNDDGKKNGKKKGIVKTSFSYKPQGLQISSINHRLENVFEHMKKEDVELIPVNADKKDFLEVFSGLDTMKRIAWTGNTNELHYILSGWTQRRYLPKPKGGLWVVASARFYCHKKDADGVFEDRDFTPDELRKAGDPQNPSDDLDMIIDMLNPEECARRY